MSPRDGVSGRQRPDAHQLDTRELEELIELIAFTLDERGVGATEVGLEVVDTETIASLNREHLGGDGPTDVLAFPIDDPHLATGDPGHMLGEIVLCPAVARDRIAEGTGTSAADEHRLLVVHGTLHLLGFDHAEPGERARMEDEQHRLLCAWARARGRSEPPRSSLPSGPDRAGAPDGAGAAR